jgi:predicted acylesterase/phospholipase RssA
MQFDMVFEGGGAKGMVFVGALKALQEQQHDHRRLIGTSAGAITATLLAVGYSAEEMGEVLSERDAQGEPVFASFMDKPTADDFSDQEIEDSLTMKLFRQIDLPIIPERAEHWADRKILDRLLSLKAYPALFSFIERGGLYVGKAFLDWFKQKLEVKGSGYSELTLQQLNQITGKDLSLVASDTTAGRLLVLNHRTAPDCPVAWAVRMSMSIPFAWHEVIWQADWGGYLSEDLAGHTVVDGGVLSNFPINMFLSDEPEIQMLMGATVPEPDRLLGLLIDESLEVPDAPPLPKEDEDEGAGLGGKISKLRTVQRVQRLVDTMRGAHDNQLIAANERLICRLPAKTYGTMEFDMTDERKEKLVAAGKLMMEKHLAQR